LIQKEKFKGESKASLWSFLKDSLEFCSKEKAE